MISLSFGSHFLICRRSILKECSDFLLLDGSIYEVLALLQVCGGKGLPTDLVT